MKKLIISCGIIASMFLSTQVQAQVSVNINLQPAWGPSGYNYVEHYYIPDIDIYYSVQRRQYIYWDRGSWIYVSNLPYRYRNYNLYSGYKVVCHGPKPYMHHKSHKAKYAKYKNYHGKQGTIYKSKQGKHHPNHHPGGNKQIKQHPNVKHNSGGNHKGGPVNKSHGKGGNGKGGGKK